ncbi:MAG TPA: arsenate reductase family protein [Gammaproteobacteria bacterium]|nr:arsenate reductase family protein [Gammaproteobacteria bacterium]
MNVTIYQYPGCSNCRRALKFLRQQEIPFESIDISLTAPGREQLLMMLQAYGGQLKKLFNTSGQKYRQLALKDRLPRMSTDEALALLASNGMLVKRPFVLWSEGALLGFKESEWRQQLLGGNDR